MEHVEIQTGVTLEDFFHTFMDEAEFKEYRFAERVVSNLKIQGNTVSGSPRVRPSDCGRAVSTLSSILESNKFHFRTGDLRYVARFEQLIADLAAYCQKTYPSEALGAHILHARVRLFANNPDGALEIVEYYAERPYLIEGSFEHALMIALLYGQCHLQKGTLSSSKISFISWGRWLAGISRSNSWRVAETFAPFVGSSTSDRSEHGVIPALMRRVSSAYAKFRRGSGSWATNSASKAIATAAIAHLAVLFALLGATQRNRGPHSSAMDLRSRRVLVTRAMGGIGDLLMMSPGLRALASRTGRPVDFAIPKKFHSLFQNNPHVNLLDIDGPPLDISKYQTWKNLSFCPAGRYESKHRPKVKKGRVELFSLGMGVLPHELRQHGLKIDYFLSQDEIEFRHRFKAEKGLGARPVIGVQPFSRDSYKDYSRISNVINSLSQTYDVIIFHHVKDGLPSGNGILSTAGMPLGSSLALVSLLDAMVCVDSAFLHAAAAFDVPVVALFGPTDGTAFTKHHSKAKILWKQQEFACIPCWRNEDIPCPLTQQAPGTQFEIGQLQVMSPCINSITVDEVTGAVGEVLRSNAVGR